MSNKSIESSPKGKSDVEHSSTRFEDVWVLASIFGRKETILVGDTNGVTSTTRRQAKAQIGVYTMHVGARNEPTAGRLCDLCYITYYILLGILMPPSSLNTTPFSMRFSIL